MLLLSLMSLSLMLSLLLMSLSLILLLSLRSVSLIVSLSLMSLSLMLLLSLMSLSLMLSLLLSLFLSSPADVVAVSALSLPLADEVDVVVDRLAAVHVLPLPDVLPRVPHH